MSIIQLRRITEFSDPTAPGGVDNYRRQLRQLEQNVANAIDSVLTSAVQRLTPISLGSRDSLDVPAGRSAGFDCTAGALTATLEEPSAKIAGSMTYVYLIDATNNLTVEAQGSTINTATSFTLSAVGGRLFYCDGVEYWT